MSVGIPVQLHGALLNPDTKTRIPKEHQNSKVSEPKSYYDSSACALLLQSYYLAVPSQTRVKNCFIVDVTYINALFRYNCTHNNGRCVILYNKYYLNKHKWKAILEQRWNSRANNFPLVGMEIMYKNISPFLALSVITPSPAHHSLTLSAVVRAIWNFIDSIDSFDHMNIDVTFLQLA